MSEIYVQFYAKILHTIFTLSDTNKSVIMPPTFIWVIYQLIIKNRNDIY